MAQVIKKATVPPNLLSELDWETEGYLLRYRLVAENKNLRSHWSPTYLVEAPVIVRVDGDFTVGISETTGREVVNVIWESENQFPAYDIFVSFIGALSVDPIEYDGNNFSYRERTLTNSYSFTFNPEANSVRVIVQPATNRREIKESLVIFDDVYSPELS